MLVRAMRTPIFSLEARAGIQQGKHMELNVELLGHAFAVAVVVMAVVKIRMPKGHNRGPKLMQPLQNSA